MWTYVFAGIAAVEFVLLIIARATVREWKSRFRKMCSFQEDADHWRREQAYLEDDRIRADYYVGRRIGGEGDPDAYWVYCDPISGRKFRTRKPRDKAWEKTVEEIPRGIV